MDAEDLFLDEILRVEMGRQGQGMILYGSELSVIKQKNPSV